jgi:hypothetical protein
LNEAAFALGQIVAGGGLQTDGMVRLRLLDAARPRRKREAAGPATRSQI